MNRIAYGKNMVENFLKSHEAVSLTLHKKTIKSKEKQFISWSLNRYPVQKEFNILAKFFLEKGFKSIYSEPHRLQFRKFLKDRTSIHVSLWIKHYGFNIDAHIDLSPHGDVLFTSVSLSLLSALYIYLKKKYGVVFLLPRQKSEYQGYISQHLPLERVNRKRNRPKRKLK